METQIGLIFLLEKDFLKNKLKDKAFKSKLDEYFDFILRNKRGEANQIKKIVRPEV